MPKVLNTNDLERKLDTGEHKAVTDGKGLNVSVAIVDELAWVLNPFSRVPEEFRTYGEGVNKELDRAKEIQEQIYAVPEDASYPCEGAEFGVCGGPPIHTDACPFYYANKSDETETESPV